MSITSTSNTDSVAPRPKIAEIRRRSKAITLAASCFSLSFGCTSTALGIYLGDGRSIAAGGAFFFVSAAFFYNWARIRFCPESTGLADRYIQLV